MKKSPIFLAFFLFSISALSCKTTEPFIENNNEILIYQLPFDLTYLRTLEALQMHDDWEIEETEKEFGIITVRNIAFGTFGDADKRKVVFNIKSTGNRETSVSIDPQYQRVPGGNKLLELVASYLSREHAQV